MKKYSGLIGLLFTLFFVLLISCFSNWKNKERKALKAKVFFNETPLFLHDSTVNKLLTQNSSPYFMKSKDSLDLNMLELILQDIPEVQNAEVFQSPKGLLSIHLYERTPLFRVLGKENYYVDRFGVKFPLSKIHVSDVPIFIGTPASETIPIIVGLVADLQADSFLKKELVHLTEEEGIFRIGIRSLPYDFVFGKRERVKSKIKKLKVFCAFQKQQKPLNNYNSANLIYKNQVVVTSL